ncbi:hypothetical protein ACFL3S_06280 [Gemmatimonadota bacterium]
MIRSLLFRGLRQHAALLGVLSLGLFLFEWALIWVAARIDMGPGFLQWLQAMLPGDVAESIFGQFGFASFAGTVSFGFQHPFALVASIAAVVVMATLPAAEREEGLLDLILSRPVPRSRYLGAMATLVMFAAILSPLALLAGSGLGLAVVDVPQGVSWLDYLPSAAALALLLMAVGAYALLLGTDARRRGRAVAQVVGLTLLFYWLDFLGDYWDALETARLLSPFHYFDPARAASTGIPERDLWVLGGITVLCTLGAFLNFRNQDL